MRPNLTLLSGLMELELDKLHAKQQKREFRDYRGFGKSRTALYTYDGNHPDIECEVVKVNSNLTDQIHLHKDACAYIRIIGEAEGFENPRNASYFLGTTWMPAKFNDALLIPPQTPHGFSVSPGGILYFVSVQSPPIVGEHHEDYIKVRL